MKFVPHASGLVVPVSFSKQERKPDILLVKTFRREGSKMKFVAVAETARQPKDNPPTAG